MKTKKKVVVAMSGGVDSSVTAALLKQQGYDVIGIMLQLWSDSKDEIENRCCTPDSLALAKRIASKLEIPFYIIDARDIFFKTVVDYFIKGYTQGFTPNPCIVCNRLIRWGFLLEKAFSYEADYLATGHYARINKANNQYFLLKGIDSNKDQSYVLHTLRQNDLKHTLFPLGELQKTEVRQLAANYNLSVATRPDSQDLCFISKKNYRTFLSKYSVNGITPGNIKDINGKIIGDHDGLAFYTIGQRKGIKVHSLVPLYVLEKDIINNELIVGVKENLGNDILNVNNINWISEKINELPIQVEVKIRYKAHERNALLTPLQNYKAMVKFPSPINDITPGQAAVFYQNEICLGGGTIL